MTLNLAPAESLELRERDQARAKRSRDPQPATAPAASPPSPPESAPHEAPAETETPAAPPPLSQRLAAAAPGERADVLVAAVLAGEHLHLAGADLRGLDLRSWQEGAATVVLDGADFSGATLSGANLSCASLRGACLDDALLVGADLRGADLAGASLRRAQLTGADLARADLTQADLRGASLLTADLCDITATGADLREALLQSAKLERALLRMADLRWSHLVGSRLAGADLSGARFEGAVLLMANLAGAQLSASTDMSYAFLYQARLERTEIQRSHLAGGVGETFTDLGLARDTYRALSQHFLANGRPADARWALRHQQRAATASHRPDRAGRYHQRAWPRSTSVVQDGPADARPRANPACRLCFAASHGLRYLLGGLIALTTGYGTSFPRLLGTLLTCWLVFAGLYHQVGGVIHFDGQAIGALDALRYSAASLTPIDAYPLIATSEAGRWAAIFEGVMGISLLGALGHMVIARFNGQ